MNVDGRGGNSLVEAVQIVTVVSFFGFAFPAKWFSELALVHGFPIFPFFFDLSALDHKEIDKLINHISHPPSTAYN